MENHLMWLWCWWCHWWISQYGRFKLLLLLLHRKKVIWIRIHDVFVVSNICQQRIIGTWREIVQLEGGGAGRGGITGQSPFVDRSELFSGDRYVNIIFKCYSRSISTCAATDWLTLWLTSMEKAHCGGGEGGEGECGWGGGSGGWTWWLWHWSVVTHCAFCRQLRIDSQSKPVSTDWLLADWLDGWEVDTDVPLVLYVLYLSRW